MLLNKSDFPDIRRILVIAFTELSSFFPNSFFERELILAGNLARTDAEDMTVEQGVFPVQSLLA